MNSKFPKSVEEQFRSSQIYKTLSGSGNVPQKVARSLEKVSVVIDSTVQTVDQSIAREFGSNVKRAAQQPSNRPPVNPQGRPYYKPPKAQKPPRASRGGRPPYAGRPIPPNQFKKGSYDKPVPGPGQHVQEVKKTNIGKYIFTAFVAIIYASTATLTDMGDLIRFAIVLAITFGISTKLFKDQIRYVLIEDEVIKTEPTKPKEEQKKPVSRTGDPEADALIDEGYEMLEKIRVLGAANRDESIRECVARMDKAFSGILEYIVAHPKKVNEVRRFMNYYLPTSIKLLESYSRMDRQAVKGENINSTMQDIDRFMYTVADAFERQLDSLFGDEAMDISADISVFETMLKQEGLQEEEFKTETKE